MRSSCEYILQKIQCNILLVQTVLVLTQFLKVLFIRQLNVFFQGCSILSFCKRSRLKKYLFGHRRLKLLAQLLIATAQGKEGVGF